MKVLVTGSEGYIGAVLVPLLLDDSHLVTRLDTLLFEGCNVTPMPLEPILLRQDFRDLSQADLAGFDAVVHLAALSNDPLANLDAELTHRLNHRATVTLARKAKAAGVARFVLSSTCSVYGAQGDGFVKENAPPNPLTPYALSKWHAEQEIHRLSDDTFCVTSLRHGTAYGWSPMVRFDLVANNLVANAALTGEVRLMSDGNAWRPLVHVRDISHAFCMTLLADTAAVGDRIFNIGRTQDNVRIVELATQVVTSIAGSTLVFDENALPDKRSYRVDCGLALSELPGFAPSWTMQRGIDEMATEVAKMSRDQLSVLFAGRIAHLQRMLHQGDINSDLRMVA